MFTLVFSYGGTRQVTFLGRQRPIITGRAQRGRIATKICEQTVRLLSDKKEAKNSRKKRKRACEDEASEVVHFRCGPAQTLSSSDVVQLRRGPA